MYHAANKSKGYYGLAGRFKTKYLCCFFGAGACTKTCAKKVWLARLGYYICNDCATSWVVFTKCQFLILDLHQPRE